MQTGKPGVEKRGQGVVNPNNSASPMNQSLTGVVQRFFTTSEFYLGGQTYVTLTPILTTQPSAKL
jgi:hypothetical protein